MLPDLSHLGAGMSLDPSALLTPPPASPRLREQPAHVSVDQGAAVHITAGGATPLLPPA